MGRGDDGMKCIEVRTLLKKGAYTDALDVVETIHIDRVKSIVNLKAIASAYERAGEYAKAKAVLLRSYDIKPSKMTVYRLAYLSIKTEEFEDAEAFYQEFTEMAQDSPDRYILRYGIDRAKHVDYVLRIATLQKLKQIEYTEEWGYELAKIYHKAGLHEECIRECRDLIIWFGNGVIVDKAKLLCKYHEEGRESLDVYGVFEEDVTPEQVRERREHFHEDTADFGRQAKQVREQELRRQIDLDMEKTVDLRQVMGAHSDQFDLLKQEVRRVWGNPSKEHTALQQQRKKAEKQILERAEKKAEKQVSERADKKVEKQVSERAEKKVEKQVSERADRKVEKQVSERADRKVEKQALKRVDKKVGKQVLESPTIEPEPRPMNRQETEAMLAASLAKVMDKANKGELFAAPEAHEIVSEPTVEEYQVSTGDTALKNTEHWMEGEVSDAEWLQESNQEEGSKETLEEEQSSYVPQQQSVQVELEEVVSKEQETANDIEPVVSSDGASKEQELANGVEPVVSDDGASKEQELANDVESVVSDDGASKEQELANGVEPVVSDDGASKEQELANGVEPVVSDDGASKEQELADDVEFVVSDDGASKEQELANDSESVSSDDRTFMEQEQENELKVMVQLVTKEPKEDVKTDKKKLSKHARRKARRAAKREKARRKAESKQLEEQAAKESKALETEPLVTRPEETVAVDSVWETAMNVQVIEKSTKQEGQEEIKEQDTVQQTVESSQERKTDSKSENIENEEKEASKEIQMADVDDIITEEEDKEKTTATEETEELEEVNFFDEYGMMLWEYFEKYQQDTRLCEDIYNALEKAMKGTRPLNFIITCKSKERYAELGKDIAKALKALGIKEKQQVGRIDAEKLNRMHLEKSYEKVQGGCILVEEARKITADTAQSIMNMINELSDGVVVILCDARPYMKDLMDEYPMMKRYFPFDIAMK